MLNSFKIINTTLPGTQPQINNNTTVNDQQQTSLAVKDILQVSGDNYSNNHPEFGNSIDNLYRAVANGATPPPIPSGRKIIFTNNSSQGLDLYLTVGGTNPKPIAQISSISSGGGSFMWDIPDNVYGWSGNFTTMPSGIPPPQYNAGPTIAEFGLNQYWHGATPPLRDTFDISTVPPGIGTGVNDGPRSAAVSASRSAGFSVQQSYNYNVGVQIVPPSGTLTIQTVTCTTTNGDCAESIGFPNDTAFPKQQTGDASGDYSVIFLDPVVTL